MKVRIFFTCVLAVLIVGGCGKNKDKDSISVMTLNVRYDNPRDSINAWPNRAKHVCDFITDESPDVLGMQEVLSSQYNYLDSMLTDYASVGVGRDDGLKGGEMNPVFYRKDRFDLIRTITFWLSDTPEFPGSKAWGSSLPRVVTWMELADRDTHDHFYFFNTHFAHDSDSARIMSSKVLLDRVSEIAAGFPFVITGDFNMEPDSKGYSILTGPEESVSLLRDSYFISEEKPYGPAYTFNGFSDKPGSGRIDYIFVKNGTKVLGHKTIIHKDGNVFLSDHWPVIARISFN
ncbi:MAG: endonuclease/exonuclease/phosphatase family protein [Chloroflexota bacterium]